MLGANKPVESNKTKQNEIKFMNENATNDCKWLGAVLDDMQFK